MAEANKEFHFTDKDFKYISGLVSEKVGIVLGENKKPMVYSRISRRLRSLGLETFEQYLNYLQSERGKEAGEIVDFVNAITTNLTHFFREPHHFEHLEKEVFKPLEKNPPPGKRLRIWSAGCSSGMETYSIAMTMCASFVNLSVWNAKILATDIDTNMLNTGKEGKYSAEAAEKIPKKYGKYIVGGSRKANKSEQIEMSDKLKNMIAFKELNLLENWPVKGPFDVIFCRNVVIYFNKDTEKIIFNKFADLLKPGGWLYIGHSENLFNVTDRFEALGKTIYRKIK